MPTLKGKEYKRFEDIRFRIYSVEKFRKCNKRLQKKAKAGKLMLDE